MMRTNLGVSFALILAACSFGGSSGNGGGTPDAATARCGDGVCAASEVNTCPQDCGTTGGNAVCGNGVCESTKGETSASCPVDCGSTTGSGSNTGSGSDTGSGSGTIDCNDSNTQLACIECLIANTCTGVDPTSCEACLGGSDLGGLGSGLGSGSGACNFNFVCDAGESAATCPTDCM
jgi:hypothetical protein